jgi:hypothetical protein
MYRQTGDMPPVGQGAGTGDSRWLPSYHLTGQVAYTSHFRHCMHCELTASLTSACLPIKTACMLQYTAVAAFPVAISGDV